MKRSTPIRNSLQAFASLAQVIFTHACSQDINLRSDPCQWNSTIQNHGWRPEDLGYMYPLIRANADEWTSVLV